MFLGLHLYLLLNVQRQAANSTAPGETAQPLARGTRCGGGIIWMLSGYHDLGTSDTSIMCAMIKLDDILSQQIIEIQWDV